MRGESVAIVTECWLYNRLAIIQASRYAEDWIASHYNLYMAPDGNFLFGDMEIDLPSYHDEILQRRQIRLCSLSKENIVDTLRNNIQNNRYIVMFVKMNEKHYHEVLHMVLTMRRKPLRRWACPNTGLARLRYRMRIWWKP